MIVVSTDGSALGNPNGSMGWAWADHSDEIGTAHEHNHTGNADAGGASNGTNQIGELCAVLEALRAHPGSEDLTIETDSQYAINCSTTWIHGWKKNGWKNSKNEPVKNSDLIRAIDAEISKRKGSVKFVWVKGHAGNAGNEKVDTLARTYAEDCAKGAKKGYLPLEGWKSLLSSPYASGTDIPDEAKLLLENKISNEEYHANRTVGNNTNPDFGNSDTTNSNTANSDTTNSDFPLDNLDNIENTENTDSQDLDSQNTNPQDSNSQNTNPQDSVTNNYKSIQGLSVSGILKFTPAPATSPSFTGEARFISGRINISGYVQPDGTLQLEPTSFYIQTSSNNR
ncbi:ribonuclease HI [Gardnerella sp. DNF00502]|uniref:ribonuclease H family protein n=1 Tax=unclassified Gardnerella TaxID=2628112 RepID=UPI000C9ECAF5|nr:ribonuclease H [Gardnerella sp. KA00735]PNP89569.1 ribonuclease HI [Gardnerella sp. KA00735]